jgi:LacI family transcriptional regulator
MIIKKRVVSKKPTQHDVAQLAGVSQTTVSLVLNNPEVASVPEETRQKVFDAMLSLGYVVNSAARMLRTNRSNTLVCIIPMITNPFYPAFVSGIQEVAEQNGYDVITYNTHGSQERERKFLKSILDGRVDGVIGIFFYTQARDMAQLFEVNIPVVRLEVREHRSGEWPLDSLYIDNAQAACQATAYLLGKGHRRIAMLTGPAGPRDARKEGYLTALNSHPDRLQPWVQEVDSYNESGGYQGMQLILESGNPPSAVFAANDLMAIGAMKAIRDAGLAVPKDIAVVGFDDIPAAQMVTPALTTIRQFQEEMGKRAAQLLIERLNGDAPSFGRIVEMPYELVIRESA